jgi:DNA-binding NtrC family response regulator
MAVSRVAPNAWKDQRASPNVAKRRGSMAGSAVHRVLIVDDERVISDTLLTIFTKAGYETRAVYSAEEAIDVVRATGWIPQFTVVDVHLPGMTGIDLAILLKAECPDCKVSLFSGQPSTSVLLEAAAREGHVFEVLAKPVPPTELLSIASRHLAFLSTMPLAASS